MGLSLAACALDWVVIDAEGPPGFFTIGGDHCFGVYKITQTNIPNCTNRPAIACARIDPRQLTLPGFAVAATMGALAACLELTRFDGHRRVGGQDLPGGCSDGSDQATV